MKTYYSKVSKHVPTSKSTHYKFKYAPHHACCLSASLESGYHKKMSHRSKRIPIAYLSKHTNTQT